MNNLMRFTRCPRFESNHRHSVWKSIEIQPKHINFCILIITVKLYLSATHQSHAAHFPPITHAFPI